MRSSTSSSDPVFARSVPHLRWGLSIAIAVVLALLATGVWEGRVRAMGYAPCLNDTGDLWSQWRSEVGRSSGQTVLIGSSRLLFDFDLATYSEYFHTDKVIQLSMPGTNPLLLLENVAEQEGFDGTLILGVTPPLWFAPEGPPVDWARNAIGRYENWSPSQRVGNRVGQFLQGRLALINQEDLTLETLLDRVSVPNRPGTAGNLPPELPPYFAGLDAHRQARLWANAGFGSPLAARIQQIWIPLFTPPPPPPGVSEEEFGQMMAESAAAHMERLAAAVAKVRARGAKVVFVRLPSAGKIREIERGLTPRERVWDQMLAVTDSPGVHFEDHASLRDFDCPEWSHLTADDAVKFTEALMPLLAEALAE